MDCDYTGPGGIPLERIAQQQGGTHPAPCARSCEANAFQIEIRRISAERDALTAKLVEQAKAEEREACAKACDELFPPPGEQMAVEWAAGTIACANAIRARGQK